MKTYTVGTSVFVAVLALLAAVVALRFSRLIDPDALGTERWALELQGGVFRTELMLGDSSPQLVRPRESLERTEHAMQTMERSVSSQIMEREAADLEVHLRRWRELVQKTLELREGNAGETLFETLRRERQEARERLLERIARTQDVQEKAEAEQYFAMVALIRKGLGGVAVLAGLAAFFSLVHVLLLARSAPVAMDTPAALPLAVSSATQVSRDATTITKPINDQLEVAVHVEVRPRR
jgi:hypothetical protein